MGMVAKHPETISILARTDIDDLEKKKLIKNAEQRRYREKHKDKLKIRFKRYRERNKNAILLSNKKISEENRMNLYFKNYTGRNTNKIKTYHIQYRNALSRERSHIKHDFKKKGFANPSQEVPLELIEQLALQRILKREIKRIMRDEKSKQ